VRASPVQEVPVARAIYEKQTINLDSWDEATQVGLIVPSSQRFRQLSSSIRSA
jgi:hypothetical protein